MKSDAKFVAIFAGDFHDDAFHEHLFPAHVELADHLLDVPKLVWRGDNDQRVGIFIAGDANATIKGGDGGCGRFP